VNNIARNQSQKITAFLIAAALALLASQTSSYLVNASLAIGETRVVNALLHITHVRNMGGTFGAFPGHSVLFALISALILVLCTALFFKQRATTWIQFVFFGLIVGGGASNVVDRVVLGSVVDFINLQVRAGVPFKEAVVNSAITRAQPILLTGLAAMLGAFFILDDPIFNGLAISLIFGILVSTMLTLVVIPLLYFVAYRNRIDFITQQGVAS